MILNIKRLRNLDLWKTIGANVIISFLICSFYVFPLLEHTKGADYAIYNKEGMGTTSEKVAETALGISDLLKSEMGSQEIRFSIGIVVLVLGGFTIFCIKKIDKNYKKIYCDFIVLSLITLVMSTKIFPWKYIPDVLGVIQFAWRNLGFFAFFVSIICGINSVVFAEEIFKKKALREGVLFGVVCSVFVFSFLGVFRNYRFDDISKEKELDIGLKNTEKVYVYRINREYMPVKALNNISYIKDRENRVYILAGSANIIEESKDKLNYSVELENVKNNTELELPYLYYLGYNVNVNYGNKVEQLNVTESDNGMLKVELPEASNVKLTLKYEGTLLTKIGYFVSVIGIVVYAIYIIYERKVTK